MEDDFCSSPAFFLLFSNDRQVVSREGAKTQRVWRQLTRNLKTSEARCNMKVLVM